MKQIIQNLKTGQTSLEEIPVPIVQPGYVLIKTTYSLVSPGTEKMLIEFSKANLYHKIKQQPERLKEALDKIKTDGIIPTLEAIFYKLDEPLPLGYNNSGIVVAVGEDVHEFKIGERVISNGHHAEYVCVPKNLVAKIPDAVSDEEAAFTVLGAVALQGIRNAEPQLGETFVVIGLGLVGILTCYLLKANGCNVIATEINEERIQFMRKKGFEVFHASDEKSLLDSVYSLTNNYGADAVIIAASTPSNSVISQAAKICRRKGNIVLVGNVGLEISRNEFFKKEIHFSVSTSYGPGRYDAEYEEKGIDYPLPYVRWTAQRNFQTFLRHLECGSFDLKDLTQHIYPLEQFHEIYHHISEDKKIAQLLKYTSDTPLKHTINLRNAALNKPGFEIHVGIIGAGNFTKTKLLPLLKKERMHIVNIASAQGLHASTLAKKYAISTATSDFHELLRDENINTVFIATQHHLHAEIALAAIKAGKHVYVEKPMSIQETDLQLLADAMLTSKKNLVFAVGFNRRFSKYTQQAKKLFPDKSKLNIQINVNAGFIPSDSWVHDPQRGGGRILGEVCHFIDLITYISESNIESVYAITQAASNYLSTDNVIINCTLKNGSIAVINYYSTGHKSYPKEKIEIHGDGKIVLIDNFRRLKVYGRNNKLSLSIKQNQEKGHLEFIRAFTSAIKNENPDLCIPFQDALHSSYATFAIIHSLKSGNKILM